MSRKKRVMLPVAEVDISNIKYTPQHIQAPHLTGFGFMLFTWLMEAPLIGSLITSFLKHKNGVTEMLRNTVIPERPMFRPEFPPQDPETGVVVLDEDRHPIARLEAAMECLPLYDPSRHWNPDRSSNFLYWTIRDYAHAYRSDITTPLIVAERIISAVDEFNGKKPPVPLLISFNADEVRKQAADSTERFRAGNPLSIIDGVFIAIKDDIDCYPHPTKGATTWFHEVRTVKQDAVCVSRLRSCGVILVGKANMHELGLGTTGNNPNYGTARNPYSFERYTGGSSSGPAALVASGICSAAVGTDGGGSVRIPSSLCGIVGLKTTFARTDMTGSLCDCGTVEVVSPLAATVEDAMLVYAAMAGSSKADRISLNPSPLCCPNLSSSNNLNILQSVRLGKYTEWFNDVSNNDISNKCEDAVNLLSANFGCQIIEITLPELEEMRTAHVVSIGSESLCGLNAYRGERRRIMYYYMEAFKKVDIIVTPTTGITAPKIPLSSLQYGESNYETSGYLMRFILAGNLLGLPAISVPIGYDKQGLPIGLQLIGRPWSEASILRVAFAVEELYLGHRKRPSQFYDVLQAT
ncbi:fatty acid amide hydrolase-like isoform X3 [Musa acuminata AAA Group]|uniref:fatty acid amide hydrolase-like isoform X3 n=1 Tax=Musa acuminata AAA Group TaxID=214697 RepID=UPI0031E0EB31